MTPATLVLLKPGQPVELLDVDRVPGTFFRRIIREPMKLVTRLPEPPMRLTVPSVTFERIGKLPNGRLVFGQVDEGRIMTRFELWESVKLRTREELVHAVGSMEEKLADLRKQAVDAGLALGKQSVVLYEERADSERGDVAWIIVGAALKGGNRGE